MRRVAIGLLFAGLALPAAAADDLAPVRACVEGNMPARSSVQQLDLEVSEGGTIVFDSRFSLHWRRVDENERRILLRFREPEELAGAALLVTSAPPQPPRVHVYLPEFGKVRSITSRGDMEGFLGQANLGIAELEILVDPLGDRRVARVDAPPAVEGRSSWALETRDELDADTRYPRIVQHIDQEFCIPLRAEFYDGSGTIAKRLVVDEASVEKTRGSWLPRSIAFYDELRHTRTGISVTEIEVDVPFSAALLTPKALRQTAP